VIRGVPFAVAAVNAAILATILQFPPPASIDVGAPGDARFLTAFHRPETGDGVTFRWSAPGSRVEPHGGGPVPLALIFRLRTAAPQTRVRFFSAGGLLSTADIGREWREHKVRMPRPEGFGFFPAPGSVEIVCDQYFTSHDSRELGIQLDTIEIEPEPAAGRSWTASVGMAVTWTWSLSVVMGLGFVLIGDRVFPRLRARTLLVQLPVGLAAVGLAYALHHDPYTTAWMLPPMPVTLCLMTGVLLLANRWPARRVTTSPPAITATAGRMRARVPWLLAGILLIALGMRFFRLRDLPYGLWRDEARHGSVALQLLRDPTYRPAYEPDVELPTLGLYPLAVGIRLFGIHEWSMRPVTALAGAMTVLPLYFLTLRITQQREVALLAATLLAVSSWHVNLSRLSFPHVFDPLLTLTGLCLLLAHVDARARPWIAVARLAGAGACFGLALQTYHTGRLGILVALLVVLLLPRTAKERFRIIAPVLVGFLVVGAPLIAFMARYPDDFNRRLSKVSLFAHAAAGGKAPLAAFDASLGRHLLMFNVKGDLNGRHHAPGRPLLDLITGLGFACGAGVLIHRRVCFDARLLLGALGLYVLPSLVAVDGPHALRSLGAISFACVIGAVGWTELARRTALARPTLLVVAGGALAANAWIYFGEMPADRNVWAAYYPVHTKIGAYVRRLATSRETSDLTDVYVPLAIAESDVFRYLGDGLSVSTWDGRRLSRPAGRGASLLFSGYSDLEESRQLAAEVGAGPEPWVFGPPFPGLSAPSFFAYRVP
jgi:4-amino-4-deoxy-L-arabinose transferase-like glycosyltransferase